MHTMFFGKYDEVDFDGLGNVCKEEKESMHQSDNVFVFVFDNLSSLRSKSDFCFVFVFVFVNPSKLDERECKRVTHSDKKLSAGTWLPPRPD